MSVSFGIEVEKSAAAYFSEIQENQAKSIMAWALMVSVRRQRGGWVILAEPNFPAFWKIGFTVLFAGVAFSNINAVIGLILGVVSLPFIIFGLFWTSWPYYFAARTVLRRRGFNPSYVSKRECFRRGWL